MKNKSGQFNYIELRKRVKIDHFCCFSDIMGVYYELNEHIDMNPLKSCQASSDTSLEYQQWVVWLKMARTASKMAQNGQKWLKMVNFQKYSHVCGVGTLNLSTEMSDKMQNESGQFNYIELRKRQKCGQN